MKIWSIEQSDEFDLAFLRTWKGRNKGRMKDSTPEAVLIEIRKEPHPKIPKRTREEIKRETAVMKASSIVEEMRTRGFRTPHKC